MSIEKSIGWTDMTRNPIKGRCLGNCRLPDGTAYCYYSGERGIMKRFKHNSKIRIECNCLMNLPKTPKRIFLCSTHDLFGSWIPEGWRDTIFRWIERYPQHTFQILTKFPQNIDRPMPDNVWLGVSVTKDKDVWRLKELIEIPTRIKFVSIEPFLGSIYQSAERFLKYMDWIIIGRLTGHGNKYNPKRDWIKGFEIFARNKNIPIFLKDNLKEIWGEKLIQEMPKTTQEKAI